MKTSPAVNSIMARLPLPRYQRVAHDYVPESFGIYYVADNDALVLWALDSESLETLQNTKLTQAERDAAIDNGVNIIQPVLHAGHVATKYTSTGGQILYAQLLADLSRVCADLCERMDTYTSLTYSAVDVRTAQITKAVDAWRQNLISHGILEENRFYVTVLSNGTIVVQLPANTFFRVGPKTLHNVELTHSGFLLDRDVADCMHAIFPTLF